MSCCLSQSVCQGELTLAMKIRPPEIKQNAVMTSDGGREGSSEVGGDR